MASYWHQSGHIGVISKHTHTAHGHPLTLSLRLAHTVGMRYRSRLVYVEWRRRRLIDDQQPVTHKGGRSPCPFPIFHPRRCPPGFGPRAAESWSWDDGQLSSWTTYNEASRTPGTQAKPRLALPIPPRPGES